MVAPLTPCPKGLRELPPQTKPILILFHFQFSPISNKIMIYQLKANNITNHYLYTILDIIK